MKKWALGMLVVCLLLGCRGQDIKKILAAMFPTIGNVQVDDAIHETQSTVTVEIIDPDNPESVVSVSEVKLTVTPTGDGQITDAGTISESSPSDNGKQFVGQLPALPLGRYELLVQAKLQAGDEPPADGQGLALEQTHSFFVGESSVCYTFAENVEGWTLDGIRDIQTSLAEPDGAAEVFDLRCPTLGTINGAAVMDISYDCLPSEEPQNGTWALDFVSPDLRDNVAWQEFEAVAFSISSNSLAEVKVQPILTVEEADGTRHSYAPGTSGNRIFYSLENGSKTVQWSPQWPDGSTVVEFRVRVFIDPMGSQGTGIVCSLGAVCLVSE